MASFQVQSALRQLGRDIQVARKKRRLPVADFCARIGVSDKTLAKLERGDGSVRLETLAMALLVLGELSRLGDLMDAAADETGLSLDHSRLPQRIRAPRRAKPADGSGAGAEFVPLDSDEGTGF